MEIESVRKKKKQKTIYRNEIRRKSYFIQRTGKQTQKVSKYVRNYVQSQTKDYELYQIASEILGVAFGLF